MSERASGCVWHRGGEGGGGRELTKGMRLERERERGVCGLE